MIIRPLATSGRSGQHPTALEVRAQTFAFEYLKSICLPQDFYSVIGLLYGKCCSIADMEEQTALCSRAGTVRLVRLDASQFHQEQYAWFSPLAHTGKT